MKDNEEKIWTNGLYVISAILLVKRGKIKEARLHGHVVDIKTPNKRVTGSIYTINSHINVPLYHNPTDAEPQFKTLEEIREEKIDSIL